MKIYNKQLNNKSPIKKLINKYSLNWKEGSSKRFAQIIKEYLRNFFLKNEHTSRNKKI